MSSIRNCAIGATLLVIGAQAIAQDPAAAPPASKPLSTTLGMVVFPVTCLDPKGYTVK